MKQIFCPKQRIVGVCFTSLVSMHKMYARTYRMYVLFDLCGCRDILELKTSTQDNKQVLVGLREAAGGSESIESLRPTEVSEWDSRKGSSNFFVCFCLRLVAF